MGCSSSAPVSRGNKVSKFIQRPKAKVKVAITNSFRNSLSFRIFFPNLSDELLQELIRSMYMVTYYENDIIIKCDDPPDFCCFISSGRVCVYDHQMNEVDQLIDDAFMGEIAFMQNKPHQNSYIAKKRTMLFKLDRSIYEVVTKSVEYIFEQISFFAAEIEKHYHTELFPLCSVYELEKFDIVFGKGSELPSDGFYYIVKGSLSMERTNPRLPVTLLPEKSYFGHESLLGFENDVAKIVAVEPTMLFFVSRDAFFHHAFESNRDMLERSLIKNKDKTKVVELSASSSTSESHNSRRFRKLKSKEAVNSSGTPEPSPKASQDVSSYVTKMIPTFSVW